MWALVCLVGLLLASRAAFADGKGFVRAVQNVPTPDQRVAIVFDGKQQSLIVDTTLATAEKEAVWIVPVPSEPTIEAVSEGFFPTLEVVFGPRVVRPSGLWLAAVPGLAVVVLLAARIKNPWLSAILWVPAALIFVVVFFLSTLSRASSRPIPVADVTVLSCDRVGVFDTAVIRGQDGKAVVEWLNSHGYHTPDASLPVFDIYAKEGWCFAAARLNAGDDGAGPLRPHPLALRFATSKAVYPVRLTGVQSETCRAKLWVFAKQQAVGDSLRPRLVARVLTPSNEHVSRAGETRRLQHSGVEALIAGQTFVTVLEGELTPEQMSRDIWFSWQPPRNGRGWNVYEHSTARSRAVDGGLSALLTGLAFVLAPVGSRRASWRRIGTAPCVGGAFVGPWLYLSVERVETRRVSIHRHQDNLISDAMSRAIEKAPTETGCDELSALARAEVAAAIGEVKSAHGAASAISQLSEGDGPNQYRLECRAGRIVARYVDPLGREEEVETD